MKSSSSTETCPECEALSDFADNPVDQEIARHLETCAACRRKVDAYVQIHHLLTSNSEPAPGLTNRVLAKIHEDSAPALLFRAGIWLRYAAVVAATAVLTALFFQFNSKNVQDSQPSPAEIAVNTPSPTISDAAADTRTAPAEVVSRTVGTGPLQAVSTDSANAQTHAEPRKILPGHQVIHVWSAPDPQSGKKVVSDILGVPSLPWQKNNGVLTAKFAVGDRTLQQLVDRLHQSGWELFSPLYPQPGAEKQTILTGRKIIYQMKVIAQQ